MRTFVSSLALSVVVAMTTACEMPVLTEFDAGLSDASIDLADAGPSHDDAGIVEHEHDASVPSDAGSTTPDAGSTGNDAGSSNNDAGPTPVDAGTLQLPTCLGASAPLQRSGYLPFVTVKVGASPGQAGAFLVDFGTTFSLIDLSAYASPPTPTTCNGSTCMFADFDFFGSWGAVTLTTSALGGLSSNPVEAGIIGTDFLSVRATTLDYAGSTIRWADATGFCSDAQLIAAGFSALSTQGFYSDNYSNLLQLSQVISGASSGTQVPNVPTVKLRVAGVDALAQLDTGFNDVVVKHSININKAYLMALPSAALVRAQSLDLSLTTCAGVAENVTAYRLANGIASAFVTDTGALVQAHSDTVLFVKDPPQAAFVCGGIGTWTVPAAQVAGSFFSDARAVIFDSLSARVWVPAH